MTTRQPFRPLQATQSRSTATQPTAPVIDLSGFDDDVHAEAVDVIMNRSAWFHFSESGLLLRNNQTDMHRQILRDDVEVDLARPLDRMASVLFADNFSYREKYIVAIITSMAFNFARQNQSPNDTITVTATSTKMPLFGDMGSFEDMEWGGGLDLGPPPYLSENDDDDWNLSSHLDQMSVTLQALKDGSYKDQRSEYGDPLTRSGVLSMLMEYAAEIDRYLKPEALKRYENSHADVLRFLEESREFHFLIHFSGATAPVTNVATFINNGWYEKAGGFSITISPKLLHQMRMDIASHETPAVSNESSPKMI